jgi:hypothetical protein
MTRAELSGQVSWDDVIIFYSCYNTANVMGIFNIQVSWREADISVWSVFRSENRSKWSRVVWLQGARQASKQWSRDRQASKESRLLVCVLACLPNIGILLI